MSAQAAPVRAIARVPAPQPLLAPEVERALSDRQREILDALEALAMQDGFAELTMAQLAARVNCSLRTLYALAPRKDALLLMVIDRRLHRIGRAAMAAIEPEMDALTALRSLNFVIHGLLEEGVAASTRQDPQAKSLGEWLRARVVDVPQALLS